MELNKLCSLCYKIAKEKGFWDASDNITVKLMLIVTELSEACEADRYGNKEGFNEEIADVFIRLCDLCGYLELDIEAEIMKKTEKNKNRPRLHGKRY